MFSVVAAMLLVYFVQSKRDKITRVLPSLLLRLTSPDDYALYTHNMAS